MNDSKRTILIIEDEDSLSRILHDEFTKEGYEVVVCADGEEGLQKTLTTTPSAILLDLVLPKKKGTELLEELKNSGWQESTPIVVMTNVGDKDAIYTCLANGAQDYFIKSNTSVKDLVAHVSRRVRETV